MLVIVLGLRTFSSNFVFVFLFLSAISGGISQYNYNYNDILGKVCFVASSAPINTSATPFVVMRRAQGSAQQPVLPNGNNCELR